MWEKEQYDRRHLFRWKEIYRVFQLRKHLDLQINYQLKRRFWHKSIISRAITLLVSIVFTFSITLISVFYLNQSKLVHDIGVTLNVLQFKTDEDVEAFGTEVVATLEQLNINQVILIGHSMGGPVTVEAAKQSPKRIIIEK
jgi:hypothetical protein